MAKQPIKDNHGATIGYFDDAGQGRIKITDKNGHTLGYYDGNKTTDRLGHPIGPGNQLMRLL